MEAYVQQDADFTFSHASWSYILGKTTVLTYVVESLIHPVEPTGERINGERRRPNQRCVKDHVDASVVGENRHAIDARLLTDVAPEDRPKDRAL